MYDSLTYLQLLHHAQSHALTQTEYDHVRDVRVLGMRQVNQLRHIDGGLR